MKGEWLSWCPDWPLIEMNMKQRSKEHHYVPKGILKHFCYRVQGKNRKIWYVDKSKSGGIESKDIKNVFKKRHYYTVTDYDGNRDDSFETEFLQKLDDQIAAFIDLIQSLISDADQIDVDVPTTEFVRQFIEFYTKRNPDFVKEIPAVKDTKAEILKSVENLRSQAKDISEDEVEKMLTPTKIREIGDFARVAALVKSSPKSKAALGKLEVYFALAPQKKQFVVGSNPVIIAKNKADAKLGDGVELWSPLTPTFAVGLVEGIGVNGNVIRLSARIVREWNLFIVERSTEVGSKSKSLLGSLLNPK